MSTPLIFQKISDVMKEIDAIAKDRNNAQQGFKFRGIDDVYNRMHPLLARHGIFSVPEVLEERREERATKSGGISTHVILKIKYTLYASDGSCISATVIGEGADSGDKASNKALSIAHKYFFLQLFAIPTLDEKDPDGTTTEFASGQIETKQLSPKPAAIQPKPKADSDDPWEFRLPDNWKNNGGKTLREVGIDGALSISSWIKKQPNPAPQLTMIGRKIDAALRQRRNPVETDSIYDIAKAAR